MSNQKIKHFVIFSQVFFFGWLLSFPFYGPVYFIVTPQNTYGGVSLLMLFVGAHTATHLIVGFCFSKVESWHRIMSVSLMITLMMNALLLLHYQWLWVIGMMILGVSSALYILGWSVVFSLSGQTKERVKIMAAIMIGSNIVLLGFSFLQDLLTPNLILGLSSVPLVITGIIVSKPSHHFRQGILDSYVRRPIPKPLLAIFSLFIFSIYLNGGFMYSIMLPALSVEAYFTNYFPFIAYIIVLLVIYRLNRVINKTLLVYLGISLLGLAFISFALLNRNTSGYLMTIGLMESSFALIDIFLWTTLCVLAFVYGAPFQIFGIILGANTASILFGDVIGMRLVNIEENNYLITALLSATSILLAIIVIPWLTKSLDYNSGLVLQSVDSQKTKQIDTPHDILMAYLPTGKALTDRETEVIRLTLQGMTNKDMARQLFISEHTVKSHLKNICNKFGVTRKKELLHLATRKEKE